MAARNLHRLSDERRADPLAPPVLVHIQVVNVGSKPSARRTHVDAPCKPDRRSVDVGAERERTRITQERLGQVGIFEQSRGRTRKHRGKQRHQLADGREFSDFHLTSIAAPALSVECGPGLKRLTTLESNLDGSDQRWT